MATAVPIRKLVREILNNFTEAEIRGYFHILHSEDIENRLRSFKKSALESLLRSGETSRGRLNDLEQRYPQDMPRTYFLAKAIPHKYTTQLLDVISDLALGGRDNALINPSPSVRAVYVDREGIILSDLGLLEVPLVYEQLFKFHVGDPPDADNYGEIEKTYSLERAFVWLVNNHSHAVVCCTGIAGLRAVLKYCYKYLGVPLSLPNMTQEIFSRLTEEGDPSSATFYGFPTNVPTISVHATGVAETPIYRELAEDEEREQIAGFFRGTDDAFFASFGISRRYARIWTPWKYSKPFLMSAVIQIINQTEEELSKEYEDNVTGYLAYFSDVMVEIDGQILRGHSRKAFHKLIELIVRASKTQAYECVLDGETLNKFIKTKGKLKFEVTIHLDCPNCGGGLGRCSDCLSPYEVKRNEQDEIQITCFRCGREVTPDQQLICECGTELEIAQLENHFRIFPDLLLQEAVTTFLNQQLDEVDWRGTFIIDGFVLKLVQLKSKKVQNLPNIIRLNDLIQWRQRARFHQLHENVNLLPIVNRVKEKCRRHGMPPNQERCDACLEAQITEEQVLARNEVCLPRIMGIAIDKGFDGIHHGHELADVKYIDSLAEFNIPLSMGIHLKSRYRTRPEELGRSTYPIKSMYTQVFYSAYQALLDQNIDFDVIGISIPNTIHPTVIESIRSLLNELGFVLLVIEENDWLKIFDAAITNITFQEEEVAAIP